MISQNNNISIIIIYCLEIFYFKIIALCKYYICLLQIHNKLVILS